MVKRIAAICTVYGPKQHADVIISKFLRGFETDDGIVAPQVRIATLYIDQPGGFASPEGTPMEELPMGLAMAYKYGVKLCHSIRAALCEDGDGDGRGANDGRVTVDGTHSFLFISVVFNSNFYSNLPIFLPI